MLAVLYSASEECDPTCSEEGSVEETKRQHHHADLSKSMCGTEAPPTPPLRKQSLDFLHGAACDTDSSSSDEEGHGNKISICIKSSNTAKKISPFNSMQASTSKPVQLPVVKAECSTPIHEVSLVDSTHLNPPLPATIDSISLTSSNSRCLTSDRLHPESNFTINNRRLQEPESMSDSCELLESDKAVLV